MEYRVKEGRRVSGQSGGGRWGCLSGVAGTEGPESAPGSTVGTDRSPPSRSVLELEPSSSIVLHSVVAAMLMNNCLKETVRRIHDNAEQNFNSSVPSIPVQSAPYLDRNHAIIAYQIQRSIESHMITLSFIVNNNITEAFQTLRLQTGAAGWTDSQGQPQYPCLFLNNLLRTPYRGQGP